LLRTFKDPRVHVCLYLLTPTVTSFKALDLVTMRRLQDKVNVVPVITKTDTVTGEELQAFKALLRKEFAENKLKLFEPEGVDPNQLPFAVVASKEVVRMGTQRARVRQYPWGVVEVENEKHSDFVKLRKVLFRTNMERLRRRTNTIYYELYREERLKDMGIVGSDSSQQTLSLSEALELKRQEFKEELKQQEAELKSKFMNRVAAKEKEIKALQRQLSEKKEANQLAFDRQNKELEEQERTLDHLIQELETAKEKDGEKSDKSKSRLFKKAKDKDKH